MTAEIIYSGELRTQSTHIASGQTIITDAPTDNHGKGEAFSPTDLLSSSLGSCMLTLMGISAAKNNIPFTGARVEITKIMVANPRRVGEIKVDIYFADKGYTAEQKKMLETAAINCPVAKSLHPELKQTVNFCY